MKFEIKKPCAQCPFRKDVRPFLRGDRVESLRDQFRRDDTSWFACHETTGVKTGKRVLKKNQSHCAGLMGVLWRERMPNVAMRIALAMKLISVEQLNAKQPVFDSLDEFVEHHRGSE